MANIPAGVVVKYNGTSYTGTLDADDAEAGAFYLVRSSTQGQTIIPHTTVIWESRGQGGTGATLNIPNITFVSGKDYLVKICDLYSGELRIQEETITAGSSGGLAGNGYSISSNGSTVNLSEYYNFSGATNDGWLEIYSLSGNLDVYDEYVPVGTTGNKTWEKIGDTQVNLSDVVTGVSLSKQTDVVLGESTTFTGVDPTITVTPSTTYLEATATGTTVGADGTAAAVTGYSNPTTDTFVKSVSAETGKNLVTTTVPNVTSAGAASTWSFSMGSGSASETLIISGGNSTAPTLGTAVTVATGETAVGGSGDSVVTGVTVGSSASAITGLGTPATATVLTGVKVTAQPTVALDSSASSGTGKVQVATGISSASASGTGVTVGTNDEVTVLINTTDVSVTKGSV